jgi:AcrR family transcriptional regulator
MKYADVKMEPRKRPYRQRLRAEAATRTRQQIIEAARQALTTVPLHSPTVAEIAELAKVARSTVYTGFGSREGLLLAVAEDLLRRGGFDRLQRASSHPDAVVALESSLKEAARLAATEHAVGRAILSLAAVDPDAASAAARLDQGRLQGMHNLADRLAEQGRLRPGLGRDEVVDVLWVLTNPETFEQLYTGRGLEHPVVAERLITMAERTLLARPS